MHLLTQAQVHAPAALGLRHLLVAGERVVWMGTERPDLPAALGVEVHDIGGRRLIPGLIDPHAHVTGGGGEKGYASRVPALEFSRITTAGITSVVGLLGTDDLVRTPAELLAATRALDELGLSAWCWTGGYHVPPATLTGSVRGDIVHIDRVIGVGEVAISDHRSSQPTLDELLRIAAEAHVGGLMSGKAGVLHLHLGDGARGLDSVHAMLAQSELPARVFHPTHVNRRAALLEDAFTLVPGGTTIDVTAFPDGDDGAGVSAADAIERYHSAGLPPERLTASTDGGGCLPVFDDQGRAVAMGVAHPSALADLLRDLLARGLPLDPILPAFGANAAALLRLPRKGRIAVGSDADLVVLDEEHRVADVMARGRWVVRDREPLVRGPFEST